MRIYQETNLSSHSEVASATRLTGEFDKPAVTKMRGMGCRRDHQRAGHGDVRHAKRGRGVGDE
jgi:hypothetical protein